MPSTNPTPPVAGVDPAAPVLPIETPDVFLPGWTIPFVDRASFPDKVLRAKGPVIVEFMNPGCPICKTMQPAIEEFAAKMGALVKVYQVNAPMDHWMSVRQFGVRQWPTFIMFQDGSEMGRVVRPGPYFATLKAELMKVFRS